MKALWIAALGLWAGMSVPALAAQTVKIGLITTLSGPEAVMGNPMRDSAELALDELGRKLGGLPVEMVYGDDQQQPDLGRQIAQKMLQKDKVDFITGMLGSNVLLAIYPPIIRDKTFLISANAGPHQLAGAQCSPYFFSVSQQTDEPAEAMGKYLQNKKIDDIYVMAPNYNAGKDNVAGFKRYYKGHLAAEVYTPFGQLDYQAEISRIAAAKPKAVFVFYPGGMGIQFVKQYAASGLRDTIPLYSVSAIDEGNLPAEKDAAIGDYAALFWSSTLDQPRNKHYVAAFEKKFGYTPSSYGAADYDAIFLIDSAVRAVHGNLADKAGMMKAMEKADFKSVRGAFAFGANHFPVQNYYLFQAEKSPAGAYLWVPKETIFSAHKDAYSGECQMKSGG